MKNKISVVIITKNEEKNIKDCLESVKWVDEIVVLDSGSTDRTVEICKAYTDQVHITDWPGFGPQKQRATDMAQNDWIFSIDADERVTDALRQQIEQSLKNPAFDAYQMPRLSYLCGKPIRHGGWYPDYLVRVFNKNKAKFSEDLVHEKIIVNGSVGSLSEDLIHFSYSDLDQFMHKFNIYSSLGAKNLQSKNKKSGVIKAVVRGWISFLKVYIFKKGFLDGPEGLVIGISAFESTYYKYLKLYYLNKKAKKS